MLIKSYAWISTLSQKTPSFFCGFLVAPEMWLWSSRIIRRAETSGLLQNSLWAPEVSSLHLFSDRSLRIAIFPSWLSRKLRTCPFALTIWLTNWAPLGPRPQSLPPFCFLLPFIKFLTFVWLWKPPAIKYQIGGCSIGSTWCSKAWEPLSYLGSWSVFFRLCSRRPWLSACKPYWKMFQGSKGERERLSESDEVWVMHRLREQSLFNLLSALEGRDGMKAETEPILSIHVSPELSTDPGTW